MSARVYSLITVGFMFSFVVGCASTPINAVLISNEKNVWVNDPLNMGLLYCVSNTDGIKAEPVCYSAKRGVVPDKPSVVSSSK